MDSVIRDPQVAAQEIDQFIDGWSDKMIEIWREKQLDLQVHDTGALAASMTEDVMHDGMSAHIQMQFAQYGVYQAFGVGYGYILTIDVSIDLTCHASVAPPGVVATPAASLVNGATGSTRSSTAR